MITPTRASGPETTHTHRRRSEPALRLEPKPCHSSEDRAYPLAFIARLFAVPSAFSKFADPDSHRPITPVGTALQAPNDENPVKFDQLVAHLRTRVAPPLPGPRAHALMAPRPRRAWPPGFEPAQARQAAGLLLIFPADDRPHVVLTVRSDSLGHHGGQVSLPGGTIEPGETRQHAATREAHEEVGLAPEDVQLLGELTPVDIAVSGFRLHPVLAATPQRPRLRPARNEVSRILEVAIDDLVDPSRHAWRSAAQGAETFRYPAFAIGGVDIWGATAMILAEFLSLVGWPGPEPPGPGDM